MHQADWSGKKMITAFLIPLTYMVACTAELFILIHMASPNYVSLVDCIRRR